MQRPTRAATRARYYPLRPHLEAALPTASGLEQAAELWNELGVHLRHVADYHHARPGLERALSLRERALGRHHPDTARSLGWLGILDAAFGDLPSARSRLQEAVSILCGFLPIDHPDIQRFEEQLARLS